jgi:hypothetical protein
VLALDDASAAELPPDVDVTRGDEQPPGGYDAIVGCAAREGLAALLPRLRPGGRVILAQRAQAHARTWQATSLREALINAGFIHGLGEPAADFILYRGERPPLGSSVERMQTLNADAHSLTAPYAFLLITQTPNKPAWELGPGEKPEWRAATVLDPATSRPTLLAFSSLVKAVAFMQAAILADWMRGVNKVGKFRAEVAQAWQLPVRLNPAFEDVRSASLGPPLEVDPKSAITGEE